MTKKIKKVEKALLHQFNLKSIIINLTYLMKNQETILKKLGIKQIVKNMNLKDLWINQLIVKDKIIKGRKKQK